MEQRMVTRKSLNKVSTYLRGKGAGSNQAHSRNAKRASYIGVDLIPNSTKFAKVSSVNSTIIRSNKYSMSHAYKLKQQGIERASHKGNSTIIKSNKSVQV